MISLIDALMVVSINCNKLVSAGFCCSMGLRTRQPRLLQTFGLGVCPWNLSIGIFSVASTSNWTSAGVFESAPEFGA